MKITLVVGSRNGQYTFSAHIHELKDSKQFHLDPSSFYLEWGKKVPDVPHHEVEILEPGADFFERHLAHVHKSRITGNLFMCYPLRIETPEKAEELFRTWCLGTVSGIVESVDLNTIFAECESDPEKVEQILQERYGITIIQENPA